MFSSNDASERLTAAVESNDPSRIMSVGERAAPAGKVRQSQDVYLSDRIHEAQTMMYTFNVTGAREDHAFLPSGQRPQSCLETRWH